MLLFGSFFDLLRQPFLSFNLSSFYSLQRPKRLACEYNPFDDIVPPVTQGWPPERIYQVDLTYKWHGYRNVSSSFRNAAINAGHGRLADLHQFVGTLCPNMTVTEGPVPIFQPYILHYFLELVVTDFAALNPLLDLEFVRK